MPDESHPGDMTDPPRPTDTALPADAGPPAGPTLPTDAVAEDGVTTECAQPGESTEPSDVAAGAAAGTPANPARPAKPRKPQRPFWVEVLGLLAIALAIALVVHTFLFQAFFIPSGSMENTLHIGDRVLVNRLSYKVGHVQRGQVIVFNGQDSWAPEAPVTPPSNPVARVLHDVGGFFGFAPSGEHDFIKRVVAIPGDHVTCCDTQGRIHINQIPLDEKYLYSGPDQGPVVPATTKVNLASGGSSHFDVIVPPGRVWVEGDHRDDSSDSRAHQFGSPDFGTIPESKIIGRAFVVVWPISHMRWLSIPPSYHVLAKAFPISTGALLVGPIALWRWRRRRRRREASGDRSASRTRPEQAAS